MEEEKENRISIEDLPQAEQELTTEEANEVKGGILVGNLLPAVQKVREAAQRPQSAEGNVVAGNLIGTD